MGEALVALDDTQRTGKSFLRKQCRRIATFGNHPVREVLGHRVFLAFGIENIETDREASRYAHAVCHLVGRQAQQTPAMATAEYVSVEP